MANGPIIPEGSSAHDACDFFLKTLTQCQAVMTVKETLATPTAFTGKEGPEGMAPTGAAPDKSPSRER